MARGLLSLNFIGSDKNFWKTHQIFIVPTLVLIAIFMWDLMNSGIGGQYEPFLTFIVDFLLINNSHAVFSLAAMFFIPEAIAVARYKRNELILYSLILAIGIFVFTLMYKFNSRGRNAVEIILTYAGIWHSAKQSYGICRLYSINYLNEFKNEREILFEKTIIYLLFVIGITGNPLILKKFENVFHMQFDIKFIASASLIAVALLTFNLLLLNLKKVRTLKAFLVKFLYFFPYLVISYANMTILGFIALKAVHGIQAFYVYRAIFKDSKGSRDQKQNFLLLSAALMLFQVVAYGFIFSDSVNFITILMTFLTLSISYLHYYHERFLFKISNQPS